MLLTFVIKKYTLHLCLHITFPKKKKYIYI